MTLYPLTLFIYDCSIYATANEILTHFLLFYGERIHAVFPPLLSFPLQCDGSVSNSLIYSVVMQSKILSCFHTYVDSEYFIDVTQSQCIMVMLNVLVNQKA